MHWTFWYDALHFTAIKAIYKIIEHLQLGNMSLDAWFDFLQQELKEKFNKNENRQDSLEVAATYSLKKAVIKCQFCGYKCLAFEKTNNNCLQKRTISKQCVELKRKTWKELNKKQDKTNIGVFSMKKKEKNILLKVRINNVDLDIHQSNTNTKKFWGVYRYAIPLPNISVVSL